MSKELFFWDAKKRIGFYPVKDTWYNDLYFEASVENSLSPIARRLNEFRARIVNKYVKGKVLDFGTGCGAFLNYRENTIGYDICPKAINELKKKELFFDFYREDLDENDIEGVTFFDVIEHIRHPETILRYINGQHIFISLPIFCNKRHVLKSKHFKINEHFWYFTDRSFIEFMEACGFRLLERTNEETRIGREDIWTYVFKRLTCESCFWFAKAVLPAEKIKYGSDYMCLNLKSEKGRVKKNDITCRFFLSNEKLWDDNKRQFVYWKKWRPSGQIK